MCVSGRRQTPSPGLHHLKRIQLNWEDDHTWGGGGNRGRGHVLPQSHHAMLCSAQLQYWFYSKCMLVSAAFLGCQQQQVLFWRLRCCVRGRQPTTLLGDIPDSRCLPPATARFLLWTMGSPVTPCTTAKLEVPAVWPGRADTRVPPALGSPAATGHEVCC